MEDETPAAAPAAHATSRARFPGARVKKMVRSCGQVAALTLLLGGCGNSAGNAERGGSPQGMAMPPSGSMPSAPASGDSSSSTSSSSTSSSQDSGAAPAAPAGSALQGGLPSVESSGQDALTGKPAPDFEVPLRNGQTLSLAGLRGKVVVLNFWATWCPPCIEEIPALNRLYRSVEGMPIEVIGISVDDSWAKVDEMLLKRPVAFTLALDTGRGIPSRFGTDKFPETFIIDKSGKIVRKLIGAQLWDRGDFVAQLEELTKAP